MKRATVAQIDKFLEDALSAQASEPVARRRRLRRGEVVEIPEIGLPGATLSGTAVFVDEYPDGTRCAVIPKPAILIHVLLALLVFREYDDMSGDALRFIRRTMGLTQAELAAKIGTSREKITRMETGTIPVATSDAGAIRHHGAMYWLRELSVRPESRRILNDALGVSQNPKAPLAPSMRRGKSYQKAPAHPLKLSSNYCVGITAPN